MSQLPPDDLASIRVVVRAATLARRNDSLKNQRDAAFALLRRLEWSGPVTFDRGHAYPSCPACGQLKGYGPDPDSVHCPGCDLAALLAEGGAA